MKMSTRFERGCRGRVHVCYVYGRCIYGLGVYRGSLTGEVGLCYFSKVVIMRAEADN